MLLLHASLVYGAFSSADADAPPPFQSVAINKARGAAQETLTQHSAPAESEKVDEEQERASAEAVAASRLV